ncbi:transcription termination/antitermination NusG family protein, partial [Acetobacter senegalensis]|uniref:transcription termination/antitermination NusG family protein n=2 Tax=Bacteria TaxID=2 RepID=UPI002ED6579D|nr:transcription termination/antitermination protein NusG [Acetobacter senegalensis]
SGYENRVKSDLEHRIETMGMQDRIFDIQIPMERVTEIKEGGKRETKDEKIFPGYVLVRMEMDDDSWTCVRNTPGVTGFLGGN